MVISLLFQFKESNDDLKNILHDEEYTALFPEIKGSVKSIQKVLAIQPSLKMFLISTLFLNVN